MPPKGWGRRHAGKVDTKLEDDILFKEIGGQLEASNFDYSQWQRTGRSAKRAAGSRRLPPAPTHHAISILDRPATVASGVTGISSIAGRQAYSASSSQCRHGRHKNDLGPAVDEAEEKRKAEAIKILQLRIQARRKTIDEYRKRQLELLDENMQLRVSIDEQEGESHEEVKKLLRKYEKFRGGIAALNNQFGKDLEGAEKELDETRKYIDKQLAKVQKQVDKIDKKLQAHQKELTVLLNYKDKEYPVKALRISELQKEIEQLKINNQDDENELGRVVNNEIEKMHSKQQQIKQNITEKATQEALSKMHSSLKDMALQNMVMKKELEYHHTEVQELEEGNRVLDQEVKQLLRDPKTNLRLQMFPEFFPDRPKCTPDMDVVLDIPTQEWLPI